MITKLLTIVLASLITAILEGLLPEHLFVYNLTNYGILSKPKV